MITFKPFEEAHLPLFRHWLKQDHIKPVWQETENDQELREKFLHQLPRRGVHPFIFEIEGEQVGYIQYYQAIKVGGGWWPKETAGTFGIDLLIGSKKHLGRGLGSKALEAFVMFVRKQEPGAESIINDPEPKNVRAIRAFERAGFLREAEIPTPGGPALLMRLRLT